MITNLAEAQQFYSVIVLHIEAIAGRCNEFSEQERYDKIDAIADGFDVLKAFFLLEGFNRHDATYTECSRRIGKSALRICVGLNANARESKIKEMLSQLENVLRILA